MGDIYNILIAGVGGQGGILMGKLLREYGFRTKFIQNVVGTETRGVSQREGSVSATARYLIKSRIYSLDQHYTKEDLISPLIPMNDSHLIIGLEPLETLRNLRYISEQTVVVLNTHKNYPRNVILGSESQEKTYPSTAEIIDILDQFSRKVIALDFNELSEQKLHNSIYANTLALAVGCHEFKEIFVKNKMVELLETTFGQENANIEAFKIGYELMQGDPSPS
ncbi:MAG: 2-oxoacid:acceptor oxidoreductase family protein [Promethearchaeia archaeon]